MKEYPDHCANVKCLNKPGIGAYVVHPSFNGALQTHVFCSKGCHDSLIEPSEDKVNPEHYKVGGIETFDYLKAKMSPTQLAGFCKGNVIKYISRADHKGKLEDLKKAKWYLDKLIEELDD